MFPGRMFPNFHSFIFLHKSLQLFWTQKKKKKKKTDAVLKYQSHQLGAEHFQQFQTDWGYMNVWNHFCKCTNTQQNSSLLRAGKPTETTVASCSGTAILPPLPLTPSTFTQCPRFKMTSGIYNSITWQQNVLPMVISHGTHNFSHPLPFTVTTVCLN
jgi:hypothetical protein